MQKTDVKQTWSYIFFGILTTIVNFISYLFFTKIMNLDYKIATSLAWALSVIFAFITNKVFVFKSEGIRGTQLLKELSSFIFFRLLSYFIDLLAMIVLVEWLGVLDALSKIIASALVAILNYFASKHFVFRLKLKTND